MQFETPFWRRKTSLAILAIVILTAVGGLAYWRLNHDHLTQAVERVVPRSVANEVPFPVYYPEASKLPSGYTLDQSSFKAVKKQAVIYIVNYGNGKKLVFSIQKKPAENELSLFYKNHLPLHVDTSTAVGKVAVGAIDKQIIASLPTDDRSWVLVTAPEDTDQAKLVDVLKALKKSN